MDGVDFVDFMDDVNDVDGARFHRDRFSVHNVHSVHSVHKVHRHSNVRLRGGFRFRSVPVTEEELRGKDVEGLEAARHMLEVLLQVG